MKKYELWAKSDDEVREETFIPFDSPNKDIPGFLDGFILVKVFEASCYLDASKQYYAFKGWKPYQPMIDEETGMEIGSEEWEKLFG